MIEDTPLWTPSEERARSTNMYRFMQFVNQRFDTDITNYQELHKWSVEDIGSFWAAWWEFGDFVHSRGYEQVIDDPKKMPGASWFEGAELNFAENLLRFRDDRPALVFQGEGQIVREITYAELYDGVARLARAMKDHGIESGDRVVAFMPNMPETIMAMLAAASMGAIWSSTSPDFGIKGVLDRFGQIEPRILFCADGYFYNGRAFDSLEKVSGMLKELPSIEKVVVVPYTKDDPDISGVPNAVHLRDFLSDRDGLAIEFSQLPFQHPLYIMYSSGTTGLPKCMVQSAGGILVHQKKELVLHTDLSRDDRIFYFTTCGWMMWNWLVCSLSVGATVILFDGSPFHSEPGSLWELAQDQKITVFGTSAKYLAALEDAGCKPGREYDLSSLRAVLSTGSPLSADSFRYVYRDIKSDLCLSSIAGGTDLNGCFGIGNPMLPVYVNELQCRALGMGVEAFDPDGKPVFEQTGELVCTNAFPSMPLYFWKDPENERYLNAYFRRFPGVWHHGDFIMTTRHGGIIMLGRSDATLNPQGVRIGTSEIYSIVENMEEVEDSVVVGQDWEGDVRVILFVKLRQEVNLTDELVKNIQTAIRKNASPRHVPAKVIPIADIPYTINMKKVELAVRNVIHGKPVTNKDALRNPESLELYRDLDELKS